ncbi:MAG: hypothetical protein QXQ39_02330 [Conexivisphaerales archaeon]
MSDRIRFIVNEVDAVASMLGRIPSRFELHATSEQELPVAARNRPDLGSNIVEWSFTNPSSVPQACVLYRGVQGLAPPYYFGNAFYAAYYGKITADGQSQQAAVYYDKLNLIAPIPPNPQGVYYLAELNTGNRNRLLNCFIFIVPAKSKIAVYEGGIPDASLAIDVHGYIVQLSNKEIYCNYYNEQAVLQYERQTGYQVQAPGNPYQVDTVLMTALLGNIPVNEIFSNQYGTAGRCK